MCSVNGRRRYNATSSLTGCAHSQNNPCSVIRHILPVGKLLWFKPHRWLQSSPIYPASLLSQHIIQMICNTYQTTGCKLRNMIASWHGNTFHITGSLWGESIIHRSIPSQRKKYCGVYFFFVIRPNNMLNKNNVWDVLHPLASLDQYTRAMLNAVSWVEMAKLPLRSRSMTLNFNTT